MIKARSSFFHVAFAALSVGCFVASAHAQNVAIVAAANTSSTGAQFVDVQSKLMATGSFANVDIINVSTSGITPTLAQLQAYDAIISWSNVTYLNPDGLGDVFADYVDAGGGVVVAMFATSTTTVGRSIGGRFRTGGYEIIPTQSGNAGGTASLGTILEPDHPAVDGVTVLAGGTVASRPTTTDVTSHGFKIALWNDGKTLIAGSTQYSNRIDLGLYPPSRDAVSTSWDPATDGARILANALLSTMMPVGPVCNDIDFNNDGSFFDPQDIEAYLSVYSEGPCIPDSATCDDIDFNNDTSVFDPCDISSFLVVYSEGPCTLCGT